MDQTMTEHDFDPEARQALRHVGAPGQGDPDLDVDGLDDSLLSRLVGLFQRKG